MKILTINAGSSSLRLNLFAQTDAGLVSLAEAHYQNVASVASPLLATFIASVNLTEISLVVHRVVHGGERLTAPMLIDMRVEKEIEQLIPLAPLHNPLALKWIRFARDLLGEATPQMAVFDTEFYQSLPQVATTYALPQDLCQQHNIRRYGFHGIAHRAMLNRWQQMRPEIKNGGRVISLQLGSGCSITAINDGVPVDTSMGFSPLEGLVMAERSGDLDPAIIPFLQQQAGLSAEEIEQLLSKRSGLLGVSGESGDMRVLLDSDNPDAQLAVDLYCYRAHKYIGAYLAVLGGVDAILIGGGVGMNSAQVRGRIISGMEWLGLSLDADKNKEAQGKEACISAVESRSEVWVMVVDEASAMARSALDLFHHV